MSRCFTRTSQDVQILLLVVEQDIGQGPVSAFDPVEVNFVANRADFRWHFVPGEAGK